jgi:hypothetical protein
MINWKPTFFLAWALAAVFVVIGIVSGRELSSDEVYLGLASEQDSASGRQVVRDIEPDGPADRAGVRVGDRLDYLTSNVVAWAAYRPGVPVDFRFERDGERRSAVVMPGIRQKSDESRFKQAYDTAVAVLCLFASIVIAVARSSATSVRWLALMLLALSCIKHGIAVSPESALLSNSLNNIVLVLTPIFMLRFWMTFAAEQSINLPSRWGLWLRALTVLGLIFGGSVVYNNMVELLRIVLVHPSGVPEDLAQLLSPNWVGPLWVSWGLLGFGSCIVLPIVILRRSRGSASNTARWTAWSLLTLFASPFGFFIVPLIGLILGMSQDAVETLNRGWFVASVPLLPLSIASFIYLSLRKRAMSFEFALNLTAVYLITGAALVAAFLVLKQNIESLSYGSTGTQDVLLSASLAALAFVAKQLKGVAENALKRLIFVNFNRRASRLEAFKSQLGHHKRAHALDDGATSALSDFCHGAKVELFVAEGAYYVDRVSGTRVQEDDEIPLKLRSQRCSLGADSFADRSTLPIRLTVPAFHRVDLDFFVVIYDAPDLPIFRPDEVIQIESLVSRWQTERSLLELDGLRAVVRRS